MKYISLRVIIITALIVCAMLVGSGVISVADALFTGSDGGPIAFSIPCISSMGPGFWATKTNSPTPVVYLYPSTGMRKQYLSPTMGVTTLGLVGVFIDCTTTTFPPITLTGRMSRMYGTAFGF